MKADAPQGPRPPRTRPPVPTRRLNLASRVRGRVRRAADRVLGSDVAWSVAFVVVMMLLLGSQRWSRGEPQFAVGEIAQETISAAREAEIVDAALTEERRREAREEVPEVYVYDAERAARLTAELAAVFEEGRRRLQETDPQGTEAEAVPAPSVLDRQRYDAEIERQLGDALRLVMDGRIVGNKARLERESEVLLITRPGLRDEILRDYADIEDLASVREELRREVERRLQLGASDERSLGEFAASFLDANVYADSEETARRRESKAENEPPVLFRLGRGDVLVAEGERITPEALEQIIATRPGRRQIGGLRALLGLLLIVTLLGFFLYRYSLYHQRAFRKIEHLHALLVMMLLSMMLVSSAILWLAAELVDSLAEPFSALERYTYLIPLGAGAILIALLANGRIATVYAAFAAALFGMLTEGSFRFALWGFVVQLSGVYAISTYRERAALLRAGLVVGGIGAVAALALDAMSGQLDPLSESLYGSGLALLGGAVGVGLLVSFSLPPLESLFNVLTDIRLLELSNVSNPLLSQLAIKAPGSYNHSLVVGTLAEEGARAVGANSLFCRVSAFYHDIGKVNYPEYFVENQRGENTHDRLSPSMSALVIASHVKDGIKMAREAGLPEQIIDIIPQHHGTRLMTFFYDKAKKQADPSLGAVKEEDFRYPGPKPQTREAAIFMIADAVEAAARTIDEPTPNRLREMIRKITNTIVLDGQLDSCDLTFADLENIQEAFLRLLVSMYHHRVDYPGFDFGKAPARLDTVAAPAKAVRGN